MKTKILVSLSILGCLFVGLAGTAFAANVAGADDGSLLTAILGQLWAALTGKQWWLACAAGLVAAVALIKKYTPEKYRKYTDSDIGGAVLVLAGSFGAALVASLSGASAVPMSGALALDAIKLALTAAGGYSLIKKLLVDPLLASKWYNEKAPAWLKAILSVVTWVYNKPGEAIVAEAEKKGDEAVVAKPSTGADGAIGKTTDL